MNGALVENRRVEHQCNGTANEQCILCEACTWKATSNLSNTVYKMDCILDGRRLHANIYGKHFHVPHTSRHLGTIIQEKQFFTVLSPVTCGENHQSIPSSGRH